MDDRNILIAAINICEISICAENRVARFVIVAIINSFIYVYHDTIS